jgi:prepilin signal peptidase PulO-like enzyme (type II secretory pathway)
VELSRPVLLGAVLVVAVVVGPWSARIAVRLAARDDAAVPSRSRIGLMTALLAALLAGAVELTGVRPATLASVALVAARRAGWRTALPFGPPLMLGAVLALTLAGPAAIGW